MNYKLFGKYHYLVECITQIKTISQNKKFLRVIETS